MQNSRSQIAVLMLLAALCTNAAFAQELHHDLLVHLSPSENRIAVRDTISMPESFSSASLEFELNANLNLHALEGNGYSIEQINVATHSGEVDAGRTIAQSNRYRLHYVDEIVPVTLEYSGEINDTAQQLSAEYAQSFSSTTGIVSELGVYLDHSSVWLADFSLGLMSFDLQVEFEPGALTWRSMSQGESVGQNAWRSDHPMEEVYLIAANFTVYSTTSDGVELLAYLRQEDQNLANRYLDATQRYLALYESMLGEYPFSKFALVENFWETGYGMPSFTLLGEQIIRFPFILDTSYPHEILHNWWGNSVYPDYATGNWSEGLTAYLADHLFQEMNAGGAEYRKDMLGRYRSAVSENADFPLSEFTSRNSAASQAVGYGKTLMLWHMLRNELGDELFLQTLRKLYTQQKFKRTSYADIEKLFSQSSGKDLRGFFDQWVLRTGAPSLAMELNETATGQARITLRQTQSTAAYELTIPMALYYQGEEEARVIDVELNGSAVQLDVANYDELLAVVVDPYFDVFRRLDAAELPPTLRQMFGAQKVLFVVPSENRGLWLEMAEFFTADAQIDAEIVMEENFALLPADRSVWIMGRDNSATPIISEALGAYGVRFGEQGIAMLGSELPFANRSTVFTAIHPENTELSIAWIHADSKDALPGLTEKLPHYGKYSYLSFVGSEPTNDVKGQWESPDSPLLWFNPQHAAETSQASLPARAALAQLPPKYLPSALAEHVNELVSPSMQGRAIGSQGIELAAEYIADQFAEIGLRALADDYRQTWQAEINGRSVPLSNIVGEIPGTDPALANAPVIIGAHYDHLGMLADASGELQVHPGADDNASGVAILLELASKLSQSFSPLRPIVFVAFTAEESGLLGSRYFVSNALAPYKTEDFFAMLNLDSVGRLEGRTLQVFGSDSAYEWPFMAQGIGFTIGVPSQFPAQSVAGSDHVSFLDAGVPALHLFSGLHADYHRPSDTVEKLDLEGLSSIALWLEEAVVYLATREQALRVTLENAPQREVRASVGARQASLGTVPEFNYAGQGVQISGVTPGGAADIAGLQARDILLRFNGEVISSLQEYSDFIRESSPGDSVTIQYQRGAQMIEVELELQAR